MKLTVFFERENKSLRSLRVSQKQSLTNRHIPPGCDTAGGWHCTQMELKRKENTEAQVVGLPHSVAPGASLLPVVWTAHSLD